MFWYKRLRKYVRTAQRIKGRAGAERPMSIEKHRSQQHASTGRAQKGLSVLANKPIGRTGLRNRS